MDRLAKDHINVAKHYTRHYLMNEPWSLWIGGNKIIRSLSSTMYKFLHTEESKQYWLAKERLPASVVQDNNWEAIGQAICNISCISIYGQDERHVFWSLCFIMFQEKKVSYIRLACMSFSTCLLNTSAYTLSQGTTSTAAAAETGRHNHCEDEAAFDNGKVIALKG